MITKQIQIGDVTETFMASAATPLYYRRAFGEDMLVASQSFNEETPDLVAVQQMAYVMSASCKKGVKFEEWLEGFNFMDFTEALTEIIELITINSRTLQTQQAPKKVTATDK